VVQGTDVLPKRRGKQIRAKTSSFGSEEKLEEGNNRTGGMRDSKMGVRKIMGKGEG